MKKEDLEEEVVVAIEDPEVDIEVTEGPEAIEDQEVATEVTGDQEVAIMLKREEIKEVLMTMTSQLFEY